MNRTNSIASLALLQFGLLLSYATALAWEWESGPGYRRAQLNLNGTGQDGFTSLSGLDTGITFTNALGQERALASQILPSGSGVAAGDVDGDGWCDLYFCGLKCGNRLYRNLGNWKFEDITAASGVGMQEFDATGAALVDIDGDGDLDLIVNTIGRGTHVFLNDGKGHFTAAPEVLNFKYGGMSLALADFDGDGLLDLYIANYRADSAADKPDTRFNLRMVDGHLVVASINGQPLTDPEWTNRFRFNIFNNGQGNVKFSHEELGEPDSLYRNLGGGRFSLVPWTSGAFLDEEGNVLKQPPFDWGLSAMFRDFNQDGRPDLYVCNDFATPDRLWLNQGGGHFRAASPLAMRQMPLSSMAVDVADVDRDGGYDVFVGDMLSRAHQRRLVQRTNLRPELLPLGAIANRPQYSRNMFYLNRGDGTYAEVAQYSGVEASEWSWTPIFLDVDLDGYEDLLIANGFVRDNMNLDSLDTIERANASQRTANTVRGLMEARTRFPRLATPKVAFRNLGDGRFADFGRTWRFDTQDISQGMCLADLDNDGDMDVVINNLDTMATVFRNDGGRPRVAVRLNGRGPNTSAVGANVRVWGGPVTNQQQTIISGGRYLSCDQAMRVFAAGSTTNRLRIEVDWPNGTRSVVSNAQANYLYEIEETSTKAEPPRPAPSAQPWFVDVSQKLSHTHQEMYFDDFARQPTLSKRLSQLGPGVCWSDFNADGLDDLVIGTGKGGDLGVFFNDGKGGFVRKAVPKAVQLVARDQVGIIAVPRESRTPTLLVGNANYEDGLDSGPSLQSVDLEAGEVEQVAPAWTSSVGVLALTDLDGDGNLDLFVGGRVKAGKYPEPASSRIYRGRNGKFEPDTENTKVLENVGMVSSAVWSDLDGDGFPELILACEWGSLRVFRNAQGRLEDWDMPLKGAVTNGLGDSALTKLSDLKGWWNGVNTADLNGDGRLEIIAGNWGKNTKYEAHRSKPLRIYYADFNQDGNYGLLECYFDLDMQKYVPERRLDLTARSMPFFRERFTTYQAYADAGIEQILGEHTPKASFLEANWLESTVFINLPTGLEVRMLPTEAQLAPAFAVEVGDFDGDGSEDVFLSQNFFAVEAETSRYDAGRGLVLKGDRHGQLRAVLGQDSGVLVYGEQRGAALADFDGDGRVDLVVSQNAASTVLLRNQKATPGLRVRLRGPSGNSWGYGAQLRVKNGERLGPVREVHSGGGYWSQDSPVQILANVTSQSQLWVRWPGGKTNLVNLPPDAAEVEIDFAGGVKLLKRKTL